MSGEPAILGGHAVRADPYPGGPMIDGSEHAAVDRVLESRVLSGFIAVPGETHHGGPEVRGLEAKWRELGGYRHVVAVNSATAGLHAAIAALDLPRGAEVIVPPYTMSATVAAVRMAGLVPVFADLDEDLFTLTAETVAPRLSERTGAIAVVHLFGQMAPMPALRELARNRGLVILEDAAQAPAATQHGRWPGSDTAGAVFSFNQHKTITCGEGGLFATEHEGIAIRARLVRNHGESIVHAFPDVDPTDRVGWNYRPTELDAAVASAQTDKLEMLTQWRERLAASLRRRVEDVPGLTPPLVAPGNRHVYFTFAVRFDSREWGITRDRFTEALAVEGIPCAAGYVPPLYRLPMFRGSGDERLHPASFPTCERLAADELVLLPVCRWPATDDDIADVADAIEKCWLHRTALRTA